MEVKNKKHLFFRADDIAELNENFEKLIDIFIAHEVPIHLATIPQKLTNECIGYLTKIIKSYGDLIEIGQHGFSHENHSKSKDKFGKYEFGKNRTYKQQLDDIVAGNRLLKKYFKRKITVFTPPWHGFDENTLSILEKTGFSAISLGRKKVKFESQYDLRYIPLRIDFNKRNDDGSWVSEDNKEIIKKIFISKCSTAGILLHHNAFNNPEEFSHLDKLLRFLKKDKFINFISLSDSILLDIDENKVYPEILAYYLNYQFVPKPLTLTRNSANPICGNYNFNFQDNPKTLKESTAKISATLYSQFKNVLQRQLPDNERAVGILLSGGLDSAAILHTLRDITDRKIYTLTGAYSKNSQNLVYADKLAKRYNTIHQSLIIPPESLKVMPELYSKNIPQPIGDNGFLSTYLMIRKLKERTQYVFSGDGADCLFCGLQMHQKNITEGKNITAYEHYQFGEIFLDKGALNMVFGGNNHNICLETPLRQVADKIITKDPIKRQVLLDLDFLVKNRVDYIFYAAKTNNVDVFLPYLDKKLINFALKIPDEDLFNASYQQKHLLRQAFKEKLPVWVLSRKKEGFTPPFKLWYYSNKEFVVKTLVKAKNIGISSDYIKYLVINVKNSNKYIIGMKIWLLLNLISWHNRLSYPKKTQLS